MNYNISSFEDMKSIFMSESNFGYFIMNNLWFFFDISIEYGATTRIYSDINIKIHLAPLDHSILHTIKATANVAIAAYVV